MKINNIILYLFLGCFAHTALAQISATMPFNRLTFKQDLLGTSPTVYDWEFIQIVGDNDATNTLIEDDRIRINSNLVSSAEIDVFSGLTISDFSPSTFSHFSEHEMNLGFTDDFGTTHNFPFRFSSDDSQMTFDYLGTSEAGVIGLPFLLFDGTNQNMGVNLGVGDEVVGDFHIKQGTGSKNALIIENDGSGNDIWGWEIGTNDLFILYDSDGPNLGYNPVILAFIDEADGSYNTTSDRRFKRDITPLGDNILTKVMKMRPVFHHNKKGKTISSTTFGFKAAKIGEVYPELMKKTEDGTPVLNLDEFTVVAIKAIQEQYPAYEKQEAVIQAMEKEEVDLQQRLDDLQKRLEVLENQ